MEDNVIMSSYCRRSADQVHFVSLNMTLSTPLGEFILIKLLCDFINISGEVIQSIEQAHRLVIFFSITRTGGTYEMLGVEHGQSVPKKTVRNLSTKYSPGTLPLNLYEECDPNISLKDLNSFDSAV